MFIINNFYSKNFNNIFLHKRARRTAPLLIIVNNFQSMQRQQIAISTPPLPINKNLYLPQFLSTKFTTDSVYYNKKFF